MMSLTSRPRAIEHPPHQPYTTLLLSPRAHTGQYTVDPRTPLSFRPQPSPLVPLLVALLAILVGMHQATQVRPVVGGWVGGGLAGWLGG